MFGWNQAPTDYQAAVNVTTQLETLHKLPSRDRAAVGAPFSFVNANIAPRAFQAAAVVMAQGFDSLTTGNYPAAASIPALCFHVPRLNQLQSSRASKKSRREINAIKTKAEVPMTIHMSLPSVAD
jgi:hypothetical protein